MRLGRCEALGTARRALQARRTVAVRRARSKPEAFAVSVFVHVDASRRPRPASGLSSGSAGGQPMASAKNQDAEVRANDFPGRNEVIRKECIDNRSRSGAGPARACDPRSSGASRGRESGKPTSAPTPSSNVAKSTDPAPLEVTSSKARARGSRSASTTRCVGWRVEPSADPGIDESAILYPRKVLRLDLNIRRLPRRMPKRG